MGVKLRLFLMGKDHRLKVFENRMLRKIFGPKREEVTLTGEDCIMMSFTRHEMLYG